MSAPKQWSKKQFIDSVFGAALQARVDRQESKRNDGTKSRWVDAELQITHGSESVTLCADLEVAEQAQAFLAAYIRELRASEAWAGAV